ncbi:hypothetical protein [Clostridium gasigenes]|uniref:hypothetical protein n=1 Tax=Clostridium gasigenes TaxID=94869 RepID=UPI001C0E11A8|nr:hypothetical protein [Clostridium gasigenes]MBU3109474.1 hypothetical protein [Clostridium gasigenes]
MQSYVSTIILIIVTILSALYTIKFFIELLNERIHKDNERIIKKAFFSTFGLLLTLAFISDYILNKFYILSKYSIIPTYFIYHIFISCMICCCLWLVMLIIINVNETIYKAKKKLEMSIYTIRKDTGLLTKIKVFLRKKLTDINRTFNPMYTINFEEVNIIKIVKIIFIFSYLLSGIIMLSMATNYIDIKSKEIRDGQVKVENQIDDNFKRDYELYKSVFVVSLIPFSLNYILKREENSKKDK